jgi:predicted nucleotidyltransferase
MKLWLDNLPPGLQSQSHILARCLESMNGVIQLQAVFLFGSYARGESGKDSDVDLCIVARGAENQLGAARKFREAMRDIWPCPAFTLLPIAPQRLAEKLARKDHFFQTVMKEGIMLASEN